MALTVIISDDTSVIAVYAASALFHEIGHLIAARLLKINVKEISFGISGVRICTDERLSSYRDEFLLAASGPFVNLVIIAAVLTVSRLCNISPESLFGMAGEFAESGRASLFGVLGFGALSSLLQGGMNLLPVNTFDGGRMLYCAVASVFGENAGERVLSAASAVSAFILWTVALYLMLKISAGLGIYVFSAFIFLSSLKDTENKPINSVQNLFSN